MKTTLGSYIYRIDGYRQNLKKYADTRIAIKFSRFTKPVNVIKKTMRDKKEMKKRLGRAGVALIFGALSTIFGYASAQAIKSRPLNITKLKKR